MLQVAQHFEDNDNSDNTAVRDYGKAILGIYSTDMTLPSVREWLDDYSVNGYMAVCA